MPPAVLEHRYSAPRRQEPHELDTRQAWDHGECDRRAFGEIEKALEGWCPFGCVVVAPPETRGPAGRLPDVEFGFESHPPGLARSRVHRRMGHQVSHGGSIAMVSH